MPKSEILLTYFYRIGDLVRGFSAGGRFSPDYESNAISAGMNRDLQRFSGTKALWYVYDPTTTVVDDVYDVGSPTSGIGRTWNGPYELLVIRAVINEGSVPTTEQGYYNADTLHLTLNYDDVKRIDPRVIGNMDVQNRGRIVWLNEVFRPVRVQQAGIVADRFSLVIADCVQVMSDEMVNDSQFQQYAGPYDTP